MKFFLNFKITNNILLIFFLLIPFALITGSFLPDLLLTLSSTIFIILLTRNSELKFLNKKFFFYFLFFYSLLIFSSLTSSNIKLSIQSSIFYIRFIIFIFVTIYLIKKNKNFFNYLFYIFIIIYSILFLDTLFQFFNGKNIIGLYYQDETNFRNTSFFGDRGILGSYTVRLLPLLLALISLKFDKNLYYKNYFIIFYIFLSGAIILLSGERTSLFLFCLFILLTFIFVTDLSKPIFLSFLIFILFSFFALSSSEKLYSRTIKQPFNQIFEFNKTTPESIQKNKKQFTIFSNIYESHYKIALKMFKEQPVFGHGPKMFRDYCNRPENYLSEGACTTHPHNVLLQLLSETGLITTVFVYFFFCHIIFTLIRNLFLESKEKISQPQLFLMILILVNLFPFSPSGNFFNNWLNVVYYYPLGIFFSLTLREKIK
jgi:O-antigen ligase